MTRLFKPPTARNQGCQNLPRLGGDLGSLFHSQIKGNDMQVQKVGVIGAGQMGNGIAQVFAASGFEVVIRDVSQQALERGVKSIEKSLDRLLAKDKLSAGERTATLGRIRTTTGVEALKDADMVVEAATENLELKLKIFRELDEVCQPNAILATNTSSISITKIAGSTNRSGQVIGMHFMNP
ncbi:MAG: 3-hydroxyacyl-CoA dehydrogenase NAD-binding domain-containing protein, partial [Candidatus Competibacteraceae bacterium]|nr:3-hydroxyacyl-CoA dehydrogenase NAD-binding domain-containing protein [Candidatus Competibacteraceae bacterium]